MNNFCAESISKALFLHFSGLFEQSHSRFHSAQTHFFIKGFFAHRSVQDYIAVPQAVQNVFHNGGSDILPLVFGSDGHVVDSRLVSIIGDCSAKSH